MVRTIVLAGVLAAVAAPVVANQWIDRSASGSVYTRAEAVPKRTVAIVPGARVYANGNPSPVLQDRLEAALELYRAGKVERILVSGDHAAPEYDETNAMRRWLIERGVSDSDVFMDHAGLRTFDTMFRAARVFLVRDAVVCTQRFHLNRSLFLAHRAGIDAVGIVADRRKYYYQERNHAREWVAKTVAFADAYLLGTEPRHQGGPIPITGDGRVTHDAWTQSVMR